MAQGQIRIIGGEWRGRKLAVPEVDGLRPTPNRIRETVFNWLQQVMPGAYCLDLFAGSGALGFEALSRGAKSVVMVDQSAVAVGMLKYHASLLSAQKAEIYQAAAPYGLKQPERLFDIVFLDPPFKQELLLPCCFYLEENQFLADNAYLYLEAQDPVDPSALPANWQMLKSKQAGDVAYHLVLREKPKDESA